jgi:hypothetical protein
MLDIDKLVADCKENPDNVRTAIYFAYETGTEDSKDYWCRQLGACMDELASNLDLHDAAACKTILDRYGISFDDAPPEQRPN